jgi:tetratricopeptide (TPR) repeat protein
MSSCLRKICATCFCLGLLLVVAATAYAKDKWTSVRSRNFLLVGNASDKDIRRVGIRLEQFREVVARSFSNLNVKTAVPTTVIVFKDDESYRPFKPNENTAGFFQAGTEVNYITLKMLGDVREQDPFTIIFHEYTHLLVRNTKGRVPLWLDEGLAEFYSTFSITGDQSVVVGRPIARHVELLRQNNLLPLKMLFKVDQKSAYYNETGKQSIFYAEAWALVHFLMLGTNGQPMAQMTKFLDLLSQDVPLEDALQQAYGKTADGIEAQLRSYVQRDRYPTNRGSLDSKVIYDHETQSAEISEAEGFAYLGDLLLKNNRAESEDFLQRALSLEPNLPMANASLGLLRVRQGKPAEARQSLQRALASSSQNYLIHYYYAYALSREGNQDMDAVMGFTPGSATLMREHLRQAIELRPDFLESYTLLAFVNLVTETDLDETIQVLRKVLASAPDRNDIVFMLAQIYVRKQEFASARDLIKVLQSNRDADMRQRGERLLKQIAALEKAQEAEFRATGSAKADDLASSTIFRPYDPIAALRDSLRSPANGETQTQGLLTRVDCDAKGIVFTIRVGTRLLKLNTDDLRKVEFRTFSEDARGHITCGQRSPENNVVVDYIASIGARPNSKADGVIKSVEFVPADFKLIP